MPAAVEPLDGADYLVPIFTEEMTRGNEMSSLTALQTSKRMLSAE